MLDWQLMPKLEDVESLRLALRDDPLALGSYWASWLTPTPPGLVGRGRAITC